MNFTRWSGLALISLSFLSLSGCTFVPWTKPIEKKVPPDEQYAYFYGSFRMDSSRHIGGIYPTTGLEFVCDDQNHYIFRFNSADDGPFQIIKVKPATCSLNAIVFALGDGESAGAHDISDTALQDMEIKAGTAYYFGNYKATFTSGPGSSSNSNYWVFSNDWHMESVQDLFDLDTAELRKEYPGFSFMPTVDELASTNSSELIVTPPSSGH